MRNTTLRTYPSSYSELCDTFRPRLGMAKRTDPGRERFIDFLVPSPVRNRFVTEHASEGRPACIEDGFRQAGLGESGGVHIADRDVVELSNDVSRAFMVKVTAGIGDTGVNVRRLTSLTGPLRDSEFVGQLAQEPRVLDPLPGREDREVFEAQVDADTAAHRPRFRRSHLHDDVQEPMPACIAGEVGAVLDLAVGERAGVKHPKGVAGEAEGLPLALQIAALQGHPAQRAPAPPAQARAISLPAGLGVLLADRVDNTGMQGEILAAPGGQAIQIKAARPALVPLQSLKLSIVAEIPDEIAGARLAIEESGERLDAVSIHQQHRGKLMPSKTSDKTLKLTETCIFRNRKSPLRERHFLLGASAG